MQALDALASSDSNHEDCWTLKALDASRSLRSPLASRRSLWSRLATLDGARQNRSASVVRTCRPIPFDPKQGFDSGIYSTRLPETASYSWFARSLARSAERASA